EKSDCKVYHAELFGKRQNKYEWLDAHQLNIKNYQQLKPESPWYFFIPRDTEKIKNYLKWKQINEIFPVNSVGVVTARDNLTIRWSEKDAWNTVLQFYRMDNEIAREVFNLGKDARDWKINLAKEDLKQSGLNRDHVKQILYRPFDLRYTYYTGNSRGFHCMPRYDVMQHLIKGSNIGLITIRRSRNSQKWNYAFVSDKIIAGATAITSLDINYLFPLYLYKEHTPKKSRSQYMMMLFEPEPEYGNIYKEPNIDKKVYQTLNKTYGREITPEEILYYIYAVFYSNVYREKYAEFLKIDFPRVPFTKDHAIFCKISVLGNRLADLHLMKSKELDNPVAKYEGDGDNDKIEKAFYDEQKKRIYINESKYFDHVMPEVWAYCIGGYQVLQKYLKDRKGKSMDDPRHFCRMITALVITQEIQEQLDEIYPEIENHLLPEELPQ
ncbi:MAG TPA: hypothetical protein PKZ45_09190, partial [Dysgonamonadaceae bacterium]|nr:hypothetical protein [Dysgonamonadaceae bacterium]